MSDISNTENMGRGAQNPPENDMDRYLTNKASAFRYPPTPDIASGVRNRLVGESVYRPRSSTQSGSRRALVAAALVILVVLGALVIPQTRSMVVDIYTGIVRIFKPEPGPVPVPQEPTPSPTPFWSDKLFGETDLGNAQLQLKCDLKLPTYPTNIGMPDHAYFQTVNNSDLVLLLWDDPAQPGKPLMALYITTQSSLATDIVTDNNFVVTQVSGQSGYWLQGPQLVLVYDSTGVKKITKAQLVDGNVLIWKEMVSSGGECRNLTYRLETGLPMEEAVKIAESFAPSLAMPTPIPTSTPAPTTTPVSPSSALNLVGETSLYKLSETAGFRIKIPVMTSKPDLVQPGKVFLQDLGGLGGPAVIMAWFTPNRTDELQLALYQIKGADNLASDTAASTTLLAQTTVHGNPAEWIIGPHEVYTTANGSGQTLEAKSFLKGGSALVWQEDGITYRLETRGTLQEAVEIAESLK